MPEIQPNLNVEFDGTVSAHAAASAKQVFREHGCCLLRGLINDSDLAPIRLAIRRLLTLRRGALGLAVQPESSGEFDDGFLELIEHDPNGRRLLQQTTMFTLPLLQFGADRRFAALSETLMETNTVIASDLQSLHIHPPNETAHLLPWHQDYPWVQDSEDALIYWLPLRDLPDGSAALQVALGSHRLGVLPLRERNGALMGLYDPTIPDRFPQPILSLRLGDVLVISTALLHRSVVNRSDKVRWTIQIRQGNFSHPNAVRRNWPGPRPDRIPLSQSHPEFYRDLPEET